jgi:hypothetical protein
MTAGVVPQSYTRRPCQRPTLRASKERRTHLVQLESASSEPDLIHESRGSTVVTLAGKSKVEGDSVGCSHHCVHVSLGGGAGSRVGARRGTGSAADESCLERVWGSVNNLKGGGSFERTVPEARACDEEQVRSVNGSSDASSKYSPRSKVEDRCSGLHRSGSVSSALRG